MIKYGLTLPVNYQLSFFSGITAIALLFLLLVNFYLKKIDQREKYFPQIIGTLFIICIAFAANNTFIYALSIIIVATLVTELEFLEKLMALIWNRPEYWKYQIEAKQQTTNINVDTKIKELSQEVESWRNKGKEMEQLLTETNKTAWQWQLLYFFEFIYRLIFGSQINLLYALKNNNLLSKEILEAMHRRSLSKDYPFDLYINFLENNNLILFNSSSGLYTITPLGLAFLDYLEKNQISLNKLF